MSSKVRGGFRQARFQRGARFVGLVALLMLAVAPALAGSITLRWDPVSDADVAGYRVYHGTAPGQLDEMIDVGPSTATTLAGLADCQMWYVAVKAYDTGGLESLAYSNMLQGYPRPIVDSVDRRELQRGQRLTFLVSGTNFDAGVLGDPSRPHAVAKTDHAGLTVERSVVAACDLMRVTIYAAEDATPGPVALTIENPDLSHGAPGEHPWVYGTLENAFSVVAEGDTTPPTVTETHPASGAVDVPATANPRVVFSEPIDPLTITENTVRLIDADGLGIAQEAGWPQATGNTVTLRPAQPMPGGETLRILVVGGTGGVKDLAGNALESDYLQSPGFTVMPDQSSDEPEPKVMYSEPYPGQLGVSAGLGEIRVTFNMDMRGIANILSPAELQRRVGVMNEGRILRQKTDSPRFEAGGHTVLIELDEPLLENHVYETFVHLTGADYRQMMTGDNASYVMSSVWTSRPGWRVEGAVESISYIDTRSDTKTELAPGGQSVLPPSNTAVPCEAEFRVTFSRPVTRETTKAGIFQILVANGRHFRSVPLAEPLTRLDGGRTIVLRPLEPMPPGVWGNVRVLTGERGVRLEGESGPFPLPAGSDVAATFATEVASTDQDSSFGVAE